jgi:hypothetical protein
MPAGVDQHLDYAIGVSDHDDPVFPHEVLEEVAGVGDLALVAEEEPSACKYPLQLELVDFSVVEDTPIDNSVFGID